MSLDYPDAELSNEETEDEHPCPFQDEINGNSGNFCRCSPAQQYQCAMDI